jgi:hypothetical protein
MAGYWASVAAALDTSTAVCSGFNSLYFVDRLLSGTDHGTPRRAAVAALLLISCAMLAEALVLLAAPGSLAPPGSPGWAAVRLLPACASAVLALLVARRMSS